MSKRLLHELGHSLSYGRLSLKAKVLWPMLVAASDDQGRGLAEADAIKWYVCPNVPEICLDDIGALLQEMTGQGMIIVYDTDRGQVYQMVRWWEYQQLQWARPSKYPPSDGWGDRVRYSNRGDYYTEGWDTTGGFGAEPREPSAPGDDSELPRKPPRTPEPGELGAQPNLTQPNLTQPNPTELPEGADAPPTTFPDWQEAIKESKNRPATLRWMCEVLYPGLDPPDYSYIGKVARKVGGAGRLADLLWQHSTHPPTGDLLAYIQGVAKHATGPPGGDGQTPAQIAAGIAREMEAQDG